MNRQKHKAEAERLAEVARGAMDNLDIVTNTAAVGIVNANIALAQVHATLATIPDPITSGGYVRD